ncbi:MAG: thiol reductant ABC exporter subunit CydC [Streptococcaceae bacterium]|jgi:ATP-binding cassette subfamily C protein CydC|nr:thiol reductant ABC exporter subunit CydC [Streptococcaceae bacterium]
MKNDSWVIPFILQYKKTLLLCIFLGTLTFVFGAALLFTSGLLILKSAARPENIIMVYVPVVLTRAFGIFRPVARYVERLQSHQWVLKMTSGLRKKLFQVLENQPIPNYDKKSYGIILGVLNEDVENLQNLYLRSVFPALIGLAIYAVIIIGMGIFSLSFALFLLLLFGVLLFLIPLISFLMKRGKMMQQKEAEKKHYEDLTDLILAIDDITFSGKGEVLLDKILHSSQENQEKIYLMGKGDRFRLFVTECLFGFVLYAMLLWSGETFAGVNPPLIAAFTLALFPLIDVFIPLNDVLSELETRGSAIGRLNALESGGESRQTTFYQPETFDIHFDEVEFAYEETPVIKNVSLHIPKGQTLAVIGRSGEGKSTLLNLLQGFYTSQKGKIAVGNVEVQEIETPSKIFGVIEQNPHLFRTTVRNNLHLAKLDSSDRELWEVLDKVGLRERVEKMEHGLDEVMHEMAFNLSGGERHRLALARVLLQDVPIVLLDEITSAIDPITEKKLLQLIMSELQEKTVIWVTHHLKEIALSDKIIFLEQGEIAYSGTHEELFATNMDYQRLVLMENAK